jgi:VanZ family protein
MIALPISIYAILLGISACVVCWGLMCPVQSLPAWFRHHDKLLHALAFAGMAVLTTLWLPTVPSLFIWAALVLAGLGGEVAQNFTEQRKFCWRDAIANSVGAAVGLVFIRPVLVTTGWFDLLT